MQNMFNFMHDVMPVNPFEFSRLPATRAVIQINFRVTVFTIHR